ncbi:hypothetical protein NEF87_004270 [Candidatus Lokiarchaeum ossiferum]|uniref:UDP-galactopyranose mutase C-terminal domain-containing protein n=1 Tax=Candidatus Lokiarchaeum ossiferum TaxID=2951803 RepID=A0ABY6HWV2_9ARCH|nr:hypothetical protein NEF87_004270 [Candidatus Lokiarchaeum sp. B-35]
MNDILIVGAGFTGSVLAERISSKLNKKLLLIDRRDHVGGNSFDYYNDNGVLIHKYGPHYFRTNSDKVFQYLSQFTKWRHVEYRVRTSVDGNLYPIPINRDTINQFFKIHLKNEQQTKEYLNSIRVEIEKPKNSEEIVISKVGKEIYEKFFKNYTFKQWNLYPKDLDPEVCARIPIRINTDDRYFTDEIQAMPVDGYHSLFNRMLKNPKITVKLNTDFKEIKNLDDFKLIIFTGCIDEFFNFKFGRLPYRSLRFEIENHQQEFYQNWSQINYPNDFDYTRIVEIKHVTGQKIPNTTIVKEYPEAEGDPFYPIPRKQNHEIYKKYEDEAKSLKKIIFVGRLAQYKYLNMDQVVANSLELFEKILLKKEILGKGS